MELMSQRVFWYIQRDTAEKKVAKLGRDVDRCKASDFPSSANLLDVHAKSVELEKAKISQRITALDDKLVNTTASLWSTLEAVAQSKNFHDNGRHDLTPPPSETSSDINLSIDEKLAQMRESLEAAMRNQIAEQSQKLQSEVTAAYETRTAAMQNHFHQESQKLTQMRTNLEVAFNKRVAEESQKLQSNLKDSYEAQITALNKDLSHEKDLSKSLQAELKSLSTKLTAIEAKIDDQVKLSAQLDQIVKQEAFTDLESRVARFEASQPVTRSSKRSTVKDRKVDMDETPAQPLKIDRATVESLYLELEAELQDKIMQFVMQNGEKIVPNERILRVVQPNITSVRTDVQDSLSRIGAGFGDMINKERTIRAGLGVQVKTAAESAAQSASTATHAIETLKTELKAELVEIKAAGDAGHQSTAATVKNQEAQLQNLATLVSSANSERESAQGKLQKSVDALWLRSTNMHAWQENFSTINLFDAIIQHLNNYFMPDHVAVVMDLRTRMANVEGQFADGSNKKRKAVDQGPFPSQSVQRK
ncbi:hypothetical protein NLG97_g8269 [Lecanicillium saksenae]|uniref:Uncharacterized protein n=1 Tax=Lecanicillium saksenae TaxID=468837 RepID=A0ACC1QN92_9HYPO|nr:hypothetical protein NLG97_g8269 [Lecanicillium saksenae]